METSAVWLLVTTLDSGIVTEAMHEYVPEAAVFANVTTSELVLFAPLFSSCSNIDIPAMLLSNCILLWYQLRSSVGVMLDGFPAMHVNVKLLNGATSILEYDDGVMEASMMGSVE